MPATDILKVLDGIVKDSGKLQKLLDAMDVLVEDVKFVHYSHQTFLPIARKYILNKGMANYQLQNARVRRSQLGWTSRWLYYHQKRTFEKTIKLLFPVSIPQPMLDRIWQHVRTTESRMLYQAQAQYGTLQV